MLNRIKEIRSILGLNQTEFAQKVHLTPQSISMIEAGKRPLTDRLIHNICTEFGVSETWLRTGEGDMSPAPSDDDAELMELMAMLTVDDMDPERKRMVISFCRMVMAMPEYALEPTREYFERMTDALKNSKKDEE